jgi:hypothetical protein
MPCLLNQFLLRAAPFGFLAALAFNLVLSFAP